MAEGGVAGSSLATTLLGNIRENVAAVATHTGRPVLVAVKANAYGHGAVATARALEGTASWFGVATVGEGVELRSAGITAPMVKLSVARGAEVSWAVAHRLDLVVTDQASIAEAAEAAERCGTAARVHLKVDTGMRRMGCEPEQGLALARLADATAGVELVGIMSHLSASDDPGQDDFTATQISRFAATAAAVEQDRGPLLKHLANSGAVLAHPDAWFDLVRPGIIAYGSYPDPATPRTIPLVATLEWSSRIVFIKPVRAGETVSYGRTWTAPQDTWIATVPVGYADGYSRQLSNRGRMLVNGRSYPVVGRICMDQTMVDLGPRPQAAVGDEVVLIGSSGSEEITVDEIADLMGTIPYEVTCLITSRVERRYRS